MSYALISGEPAKEYEDFIIDTLETLQEYTVKGIAIVAIVKDGENPEDQDVTGYWHLSAPGKAYASAVIQMDAVDDMIRTNIDRYKEAMDNLDED